MTTVFKTCMNSLYRVGVFQKGGNIDTRFQLWLDDCMSAPSRNQVDDSILNFSPIIEAIRFGTFAVTLPLTFATPKDKNTPAPTGGAKRQERKDDDDNQAKKKKGRTQGREGGRVTNDSPPASCNLQQGETWGTHFANKGVADRIDWNGTCKMCPRWFIRGFCFPNCVNTASHVKSEEIPADKLTAFEGFMRTCRNA